MTMIQTRDGTNLRVKTLGAGRPVVLIHGWPLSADSWDPVMIALAEAGYRAIAYDRRGFGRSDHADKGYDYDTFTDDLADVMAATGATDDVALVGFSMGGGEIARYMSRHGGRGVSQAVLVSSVVPFMARTDDNPKGVPDKVFADMTEGMKTDFRKFFTSFFKQFYGVGLLSHPVSDEELHWAWQTTMQASQYATIQSAGAFAYTDFRPDLPHFQVPTLVIHGTADATVPIEATGREVAAQVPSADLIEYEGEPHGVFATQTQRLSDDIVNFLGGGKIEGRQGMIDAMTADTIAMGVL
ncbi:alpha/beta fold hydrolase [Novosphingobium sp. AP12]|uniref:alpha/beta fold hydrolase n=1 Tax=Novosphingobium sp. AP12 TaxID=1144305 RepID=UPI0002720AF6|nr:alpha/beta hydrolase [Novosphingobium sp. AP12]EJL25549.1 putative hydrolase or acyltransferase of alpha/beta superfamily [Novosphingobium sp. AP12]